MIYIVLIAVILVVLFIVKVIHDAAEYCKENKIGFKDFYFGTKKKRFHSC